MYHHRLNRWLLPGGHVEESDDSLALAAAREAHEETLVRIDFDRGSLLAGIDVHGIPPKKKEPFHLHHDLIFLFRALSGEFRVSEESRAVAWCAPAEFDRYDVPGNVRRVWGRVLTR